MTDIDDDRSAAPTGTLIERMGITVLAHAAERAVATMPVAGNTQPMGLLHGGASAALAETVGSYAAYDHAGPGRAAVGVDLSITHHRPVTTGEVTATATALHLGRTVCSYAIEVVDDAGRRTASARLTCMLIPSPQES